MSAEFRALFLGLAVVLFLVAAFNEFRRTVRPGRPVTLGLVAAGLASGFFPWFWDALDLAMD